MQTVLNVSFVQDGTVTLFSLLVYPFTQLPKCSVLYRRTHSQVNCSDPVAPVQQRFTILVHGIDIPLIKTIFMPLVHAFLTGVP